MFIIILQNDDDKQALDDIGYNADQVVVQDYSFRLIFGWLTLNHSYRGVDSGIILLGSQSKDY